MNGSPTSNLADLHARWRAKPNFRPGVKAIPPIEQNMTVFSAGSVEFGLEVRELTEEIKADHISRLTVSGYSQPESILDDDRGLTVHVFDASNRVEYLRFDCFEYVPHYHYFVSELDGVVNFWFDVASHGEMFPWVCQILRHRLSPMLDDAGASHLAVRLDAEAIGAAVSKLEDVVS